MERKKRGPKGLGLSGSAMKRRKSELDKIRKSQTRTVGMSLETYARWIALAKVRGLSAKNLVVALLDEVDEYENALNST